MSNADRCVQGGSPAIGEWETVETRPDQDGVRRFRVPGGWLYQTRGRIDWFFPDSDRDHHCLGWNTPKFVPDTLALDPVALDKVSATVESIRAMTMADESATYVDRQVVAALTDIVTLLRRRP